MKHVIKRNSRFSALIVLVLVAAMVLSFAACGGKTTSSEANTGPSTSVTEVGEGAKSFEFQVVDGDGNATVFTVSTDAETVGEALLDVGLIDGEDSAYGLYVKTVNGLTVDYDTDGKYWAFYVNGEYASTGVDSTEIEEGAVYSFKVE